GTARGRLRPVRGLAEPSRRRVVAEPRTTAAGRVSFASRVLRCARVATRVQNGFFLARSKEYGAHSCGPKAKASLASRETPLWVVAQSRIAGTEALTWGGTVNVHG